MAKPDRLASLTMRSSTERHLQQLPYTKHALRHITLPTDQRYLMQPLSAARGIALQGLVHGFLNTCVKNARASKAMPTMHVMSGPSQTARNECIRSQQFSCQNFVEMVGL